MPQKPFTLVRSPGRIEVHPDPDGRTGIRLLGWLEHHRAQKPLEPHLHPGCAEVCLLARGRQSYHVGGMDYVLRGGDVFVTWPDETHGTESLPQEKCILYWFQLCMEPGTPLAGLPPEASDRLRQGLRSALPRLGRAPPEVFPLLESLFQLIRMEDPWMEALLDARMREILVALVRPATHPADARGRAQERVQAAIRLMKANLAEPPPLARLAEAAGCSLPRFKVLFRERTGMPPGEYLARLRLSAAADRLRAGGESVTRIAMDLGYSTSQSFAAAFRRQYGLSPTEYRTHPPRTPAALD